MPALDGDEKSVSDFEFKFQQFLHLFRRFEALLDWAKDLEVEPKMDDLASKNYSEHVDDDTIDVHDFNAQIFFCLSLCCTGSALQTVKNIRGDEGCRGVRVWHQLT